MAARALIVLIGLFHLANGAAMLADPAGWCAAVPGVAATGPFNPHFVTDVGLVYLASGAGMLAALGPSSRGATFALAGAVWPALHALFHVIEWFADGFPGRIDVAATEAVGVVLVGFIGLALALARARQTGVL